MRPITIISDKWHLSWFIKHNFPDCWAEFEPWYAGLSEREKGKLVSDMAIFDNGKIVDNIKLGYLKEKWQSIFANHDYDLTIIILADGTSPKGMRVEGDITINYKHPDNERVIIKQNGKYIEYFGYGITPIIHNTDPRVEKGNWRNEEPINNNQNNADNDDWTALINIK